MTHDVQALLAENAMLREKLARAKGEGSVAREVMRIKQRWRVFPRAARLLRILADGHTRDDAVLADLLDCKRSSVRVYVHTARRCHDRIEIQACPNVGYTMAPHSCEMVDMVAKGEIP